MLYQLYFLTTFVSKLAKSANPPDELLSPNISDGVIDFVGVGPWNHIGFFYL